MYQFLNSLPTDRFYHSKEIPRLLCFGCCRLRDLFELWQVDSARHLVDLYPFDGIGCTGKSSFALVHFRSEKKLDNITY